MSPRFTRQEAHLLTLFLSCCYANRMDWALAIERNRQPLLRIVAVLLQHDRPWRRQFRRARVAAGPPGGAVGAAPGRSGGAAADRGGRPRDRRETRRPPARHWRGASVHAACDMGEVSFQLFDPRRVLVIGHGWRAAGTRGEPRIHVIDVVFDPRIPLFRPAPAVASDEPDPPEDHTVDAGPLCRRLVAIRSALEDLPRQAKRYARWRARPPRPAAEAAGPAPHRPATRTAPEANPRGGRDPGRVPLARPSRDSHRHVMSAMVCPHARASRLRQDLQSISGSVSTAPVTISCCRHRESGGAGAARQARRRGPRPESTEGSAASCRAPEHSCPTLR